MAFIDDKSSCIVVDVGMTNLSLSKIKFSKFSAHKNGF